MRPSSENLTIKQARRAVGSEVTIHRVDGGFIVEWSEAEIIPEDRREEGGRHYEVLNKRAVREKIEHAMELVQELLVADRVTGNRWG